MLNSFSFFPHTFRQIYQTYVLGNASICFVSRIRFLATFCPSSVSVTTSRSIVHYSLQRHWSQLESTGIMKLDKLFLFKIIIWSATYFLKEGLVPLNPQPLNH